MFKCGDHLHTKCVSPCVSLLGLLCARPYAQRFLPYMSIEKKLHIFLFCQIYFLYLWCTFRAVPGRFVFVRAPGIGPNGINMFNLISIGMSNVLSFSEFSAKFRIVHLDFLNDCVKSAIEKSGLTQDQIACSCGVDPAIFSKILERRINSSYIQVEYFVYVCNKLCVDAFPKSN